MAGFLCWTWVAWPVFYSILNLDSVVCFLFYCELRAAWSAFYFILDLDNMVGFLLYSELGQHGRLSTLF